MGAQESQTANDDSSQRKKSFIRSLRKPFRKTPSATGESLIRSTDEPVILANNIQQLSKRDIILLNRTFELLKSSDTPVAQEIHKRVSSIDGALDRYQKQAVVFDDGFVGSMLGKILLGGIERCLLRASNFAALERNLEQMKTRHSSAYNVPNGMMAKAVEKTEPVIIDNILQCIRKSGFQLTDDDEQVEGGNSGDIEEEVKLAWHKFFELLLSLF